MDGNTPGQEKALLRREPVRARKVIGAALEGWAESSRIRNQKHQRLASEIDRTRETAKNPEAEPRNPARQLAIYEGRSNPSGKAAIPSRKRKKRSNRLSSS